MELLQTLKTPILTQVQTSKAVRPVYYSVRRKKKYKIGVRLQKKIDDGIYTIPEKGKDRGFVLDENGNRIVANKRTAGKPRMHTVAGNEFVTGFANFGHRNSVVSAIKATLLPFMEDQLVRFEKYPLYINWYMVDNFDNNKISFDLSNMWFWNKYMEDNLSDLGFIPDDEWKWITKSGSTPIVHHNPNLKHRCFVWKFYHDDRDCIKANPMWTKWHNESN